MVLEKRKTANNLNCSNFDRHKDVICDCLTWLLILYLNLLNFCMIIQNIFYRFLHFAMHFFMWDESFNDYNHPCLRGICFKNCSSLTSLKDDQRFKLFVGQRTKYPDSYFFINIFIWMDLVIWGADRQPHAFRTIYIKYARFIKVENLIWVNLLFLY